MKLTHKAQVKRREKRKSTRITVPLPIKYEWFSKKDILREALCQNISGSGMMIRVDRPLEVGEHLKTLFYFPQDAKPINAISEVVWCRKTKSKEEINFDAGIRHIRIEKQDRERFVFLFCETMINFLTANKAIKQLIPKKHTSGVCKKV